MIVECTYHIFGTKIGRSRKASNTQYREIHDNSNDIQMVFSHASKDQRDEASQPQQDSAFHDKWYSFHMGEGWFSYWYSLPSPSYYHWTLWC